MRPSRSGNTVLKNPFQIPALHNCFSRGRSAGLPEAKSLASRAIRCHPPRYINRLGGGNPTACLPQAFGYEDPPEGWFLTQLPTIPILRFQVGKGEHDGARTICD